MVRDAWSSKEIKITKDDVPVYLNERCSYSGLQAPSGAEVSERVGAWQKPIRRVQCPGCEFWVQVRRDGCIQKHINRGPGDSQDVIILQTTRRCRIEIPGSDLQQFIDQLIETLNRKVQQ